MKSSILRFWGFEIVTGLVGKPWFSWISDTLKDFETSSRGIHKYFSWCQKDPTDPFTILEIQNPSHSVLELGKILPSPDREAPKLW